MHRKRNLAFGAPQRPGVYLFRDVHDQVLYVGRARDLRARLRSYFRSDRQRPAVESALGALDRIEWRVTRLGARGRARGAAADPRAATAGERALGASRPVRLSPPARRHASSARRSPTELGPAHEPTTRAARGARAPGRRVGDARRRAAEAAGEARSGSRATCASRTLRACATGSRRSRTSSRELGACAGCASSPCASSLPASRTGRAGRSTSRKGQVVVRPAVPRAARARVAGRARRRRPGRADARPGGGRRAARRRVVPAPAAAGAGGDPAGTLHVMERAARARARRRLAQSSSSTA